MENNQQNSNRIKDINRDGSSLKNQQSGEHLHKVNETENANRFAETSNSEEEHGERGSRSAENETLGTP